MLIIDRLKSSPPAAQRRALALSASAAVLAIAAFGASQAVAQTTTGANPAPAPSKGSNVSEVVVTARHGLEASLETKREAVTSTEVISAEQLEEIGAQLDWVRGYL